MPSCRTSMSWTIWSARLARLSDDEKRLFALICRSYLAAVMPDFEYRQTVVTMEVPVPARQSRVEFRAVGRIPLVQGWKAVYGGADPEGGQSETEQTLPPLVDGETATLTRAARARPSDTSRRRATTKAR